VHAATDWQIDMGNGLTDKIESWKEQRGRKRKENTPNWLVTRKNRGNVRVLISANELERQKGNTVICFCSGAAMRCSRETIIFTIPPSKSPPWSDPPTLDKIEVPVFQE
jgi:hypothetical protein